MYTKEQFIDFWKGIVPIGMTLDLDVHQAWCYFEIETRRQKMKIEYHINKISHEVVEDDEVDEGKAELLLIGKMSADGYSGDISITEDEFMSFPVRKLRICQLYHPESWLFAKIKEFESSIAK